MRLGRNLPPGHNALGQTLFNKWHGHDDDDDDDDDDGDDDYADYKERTSQVVNTNTMSATSCPGYTPPPPGIVDDFREACPL